MSSFNSTSKRSWGVRFRKAVQLLGGVTGVLLLCLPLFSQGSFGRILGTVTDQSGGVVAGATVTIVDTDRGVTKTLVTNEAGEYSAPTLNPGNYKVRAEAKGFKIVERQNVVLEVGKEVRVDMSLAPGAVAETITITESAPTGGNHQRHPGGHHQQRGHQRHAFEWPQLPELVGSAPGHRDPAGWRTLGPEHQRHSPR